MKSIFSLRLLGRVETSDGAGVGLCCGRAEAGHDPTSCPSSRVTTWRDKSPGKSPVPSGSDVEAVTASSTLLVPFALSAPVCVEWEKSYLMEMLLRKPVSLICSLMFAQLESWWQFRQRLLKHWECVMCSTASAPAWHGPSRHREAAGGVAAL